MPGLDDPEDDDFPSVGEALDDDFGYPDAGEAPDDEDCEEDNLAELAAVKVTTSGKPDGPTTGYGALGSA